MILNYIQRWQELGVHLGVCECDEQKGKTKFIKNIKRIDPSDAFNKDWINYNFLFIDLGQSGFSCLDIEGTKNSVETFIKRLDTLGIPLSSLFYERSLNNGIHVYFRGLKGSRKRNHAKLRSGDILFDILNKGKAFTSPSILGNKKYLWGDLNPFTINSLQDIQEVPLWVNTLFNMD